MGGILGRKALLANGLAVALAGSMGFSGVSHAQGAAGSGGYSLVGEALSLTRTLREWSNQRFTRRNLPLGYCEKRKRVRAVLDQLGEATFSGGAYDADLAHTARDLADAEFGEHMEWEQYDPEDDEYYNDDICDPPFWLAIRGDPPGLWSVRSYERTKTYDWTGFYIGINGGWGWGRTFWDEPGSSSGFFGLDGGLFGGTAGFNLQKGPVVFGIEGTIDATNIRGMAMSPNCPSCSTANTYLGTVDGRVGYAASNFLPYIKGGVAFGNIQQKVGGFPGTDDSKVGWNVGGGLEWAATRQLSLKVELNHIDLGSTTCGLATCGGTATTPFRVNTFVFGANYNFHH
jgi:outer membrane immunogenic protein